MPASHRRATIPGIFNQPAIDQRELPLDGEYAFESSAANVTVYVIDTGILLGHQEFSGRLITGFDAVTSGGNANDCNGHGTHVAGTIGGTVYGVAKGVKLSPIRVLACNGSGTTSGVIAGVDWVAEHHVKPAVANMSLGGGASTALDTAVRNAVSRGVTFAVAAGNGDWRGRQANACNYSPARVETALTVSATNSTDTKASWANYGNCVDLFAPGVSITSAWHTSTTATNTISGTSMAAPHVAGVAALFLATNADASPAAVFEAIRDAVTTGVVKSSSTAKNDLVYSLFGGTTEQDPDGVPDEEEEHDEGQLTVTLYKLQGLQKADLTWSGLQSTNVVVSRNTSPMTVPNTGAYTDDINQRGGGTYTYQVCEVGTSICTDAVTASF